MVRELALKVGPSVPIWGLKVRGLPSEQYTKVLVAAGAADAEVTQAEVTKAEVTKTAFTDKASVPKNRPEKVLMSDTQRSRRSSELFGPLERRCDAPVNFRFAMFAQVAIDF